jgi:hypothetical protein
VRVHNLTDSSIDLLVTAFFRCADNLQERAARERLLIDILRLAPTVGVEFGNPTGTLQIASDKEPEAFELFSAETEKAA